MAKPMWAGFVSAIVLALICTGIYTFIERSDVAQATPGEVDTIVGVDANPTGNTGTSLGTINSCISVDPGAVFSIDLVIQDVTNLKSFDGTFRFDGDIVEVTGVDVVGPVGSEYFLATAEGSNVTSYSGSVPNNSGSFQVSGVDYGEAPESGKGILARLEITASGPDTGISKANFDWRPDGYPISGVYLEDETGTPIGDLDGDRQFDGFISNAEIAVDEYCPGECLSENDTDSDGFNDEIECYLGTDPLDDCPNNPSHDAWPLDINMDRYVTVVEDVLTYAGKISPNPVSSDPPGSSRQRLDLNDDDVITVVGDVLMFAGHIGETCS